MVSYRRAAGWQAVEPQTDFTVSLPDEPAESIDRFWHSMVHSFHCAARPEPPNCFPATVNTLHGYLTRQVIASLLMTVAVFTFVLLVGNVLREVLTLLVNRQASLGAVTEAVGLLIPFVWVFALPMALLTATLLVFGRFSADQELTAVRASGISLLSLITPILLLSLLLCGISAVVNLDIAPRCRVAYKDLLYSLGAELTAAQLPEGRFLKERGHIIYVGKNDGGDLRDVMILKQEEDPRDTTTIRAPRGKLLLDTTNSTITLQLFDARSIKIEDGRVMLSSGDVTLPPFELNPTRKSRRPRLTEMTYTELREELRELEELISRPLFVSQDPETTPQNQQRELEKQLGDLTSPVRVQIHRQAAFSLACFGFALIGIPLGIRMHRRETNVGVGVALVLVAVYYSFILIGESLATRPEFAPHLIVWVPNLLFQAVGIVLLWRANRGV